MRLDRVRGRSSTNENQRKLGGWGARRNYLEKQMPESEGSSARGQSQSVLQEACKFISRGVLLNNRARLLTIATVRKKLENTNKSWESVRD